MKRKVLLFSALAGLGVAGLVACGNKVTTSNNKVELSRDQSLSMQAATSLTLLDSFGNNSQSLMSLHRMKENNEALTDEQVNDIITILPTLDLMLENGKTGFVSVIEEGEFIPVEGGETYNTKETISFAKSGLSENETYTLYYSVVREAPLDPETPVDPETPADPEAPVDPETPADPEAPVDPEATPLAANDAEEDEDSDDDEEDSEEIETEESISGIATTDGTEFIDFESVVEKEVSAEETEEERTFTLTFAENTYIEVKQEHEVEGNEVETEFAYKVVEEGAVTLEYSIEIETEDDELSIGYEIGNVEYELVKEVTDTETIYHVEYENEDTDTEALVSFRKEIDEEGNVSYTRI